MEISNQTNNDLDYLLLSCYLTWLRSRSFSSFWIFLESVLYLYVEASFLRTSFFPVGRS